MFGVVSIHCSNIASAGMDTRMCTSSCCLQAFKVARVMAPSVIYIDEIEKVMHEPYTCICWNLVCCQALLID